MEKINYRKLKLRAGLEIHQQLNTANKLFCECSTEMKEKTPIKIIKRKQHPVASELGEVDIASQYEYLRDRNFLYQIFSGETCLVDLDEEPPHKVNQEALDIALQISLLLNCEIPNEVQIMRKTITDGSNTSAFQRSMIVGLNGYLKFKGKKILIKQVSLEEDSAAIVSEENQTVVYRLNRLGVPLVEISTGLLEKFTPEEIQEIAYQIGMICRSTGKVKRGVGSIRQDVNVSIKNGSRVEIKGVQELGLLSKVIEFEVQRQLSLISLKSELRKKGIRKITSRPVDVTSFLRDSRSKTIQSILENNGNIFAVKLPKFNGLLKKEVSGSRTLGRELADYASAFGIKDIINSDEHLIKYQLSDEFKRIRDYLKAESEDAVVLIGEFREKGKAANVLVEKINQLLISLEQETRAANEDGTTRYIRPLPGSARLYPESDLIPVFVLKEKIDMIKKELPEPWTRKIRRFKSKLKLSDDLAKQLIRSDYLELFEEIMKNFKIEASVVANTFVSTLKDLEKREGVRVDNLADEHFLELFEFLSEGKITKEAIPEVLKHLSSNPEASVAESISKLNLTPISSSELKKIISDVVSRQPEIPKEKLIGIVMSKVRGRVEARDVIDTVRRVKKY